MKSHKNSPVQGAIVCLQLLVKQRIISNRHPHFVLSGQRRKKVFLAVYRPVVYALTAPSGSAAYLDKIYISPFPLLIFLAKEREVDVAFRMQPQVFQQAGGVGRSGIQVVV